MSQPHPISQLLDAFWSTYWISNYAYYISFRISGSQESNSLNGMQFGVETKKLWLFEDEHSKLSGNFAAETPFGRVFSSCETTPWHTSATSQHRTPISQLRNGLQKSPSSTKSSLHCGNDLQASKMGCDLLFYVSFFLLATKWLQDDLQAAK